MKDLPPHNLQAEQTLLGAILTDNEVMERVAEYLLPHHFAMPEHGILYDKCKQLIDENQTANTITLAASLADELPTVGGVEYLAQLMGSAVTIINSGEYGRIIYDLAQKRELIHLSEYIAESTRTQAEHSEIIETVERELTALTDDNSHDVSTPKSQMGLAIANIEAAFNGDIPPGQETGLTDLDNILSRLRDGSVYVIGARPSMGKSVLALQIAEKISETKPVSFFSLEMPAEELQERRISTHANISYEALRAGTITSDEMKRSVESSNILEQKPMFVNDKPGVSVEYIRRHARRQMRKTGVRAVFIDYLQLMSGDGFNRVDIIGNITRGLKTLAKELRCPVVALSQLNRGVEGRDSQVPRMSDLRESGDIEQDADVIVFIHREEQSLNQRKLAMREGETTDSFNKRLDGHANMIAEAKGLADLIIAKNRQGITGMIECGFDGAHMKFTNIAHTGER
ncbi:MAG: replicative DNA helicase [Candidatus Omnitrophica bacterium]|nr:replicative DNA helicase [Candidatus Omnitrophota bacterium]